MKRLLCSILAIAMILSMIPSVFALTYGDADVPESLHYVFTAQAHGDGSAHLAMSETNQTIEKTVTETSSGRWGFVAKNGAIGLTARKDGFTYWTFKTAETGEDPSVFPVYNPENASYPAMILELEVKESGRYVPTIEYQGQQLSPILEVFLVEKEDGESITNILDYIKSIDVANRLGQVNTYSNPSNNTAEKSFSARELEKGNYYLVLIPNGADAKSRSVDDSSKCYAGVYLRGLRLDSVPYDADAEFEYKFTTDSFDIIGKNDSTTGMTATTTKADALDGKTVGAYQSGNSYTIYNFGYIKGGYDYLLSTETDSWQFAPGTSYGKARGSYITSSGLTFSSYVSRVNGGNLAYYILKVKIPYTGKYDMSLTGTIFANAALSVGADADVHIVPVTSKNSSGITLSDLTADNKIGSYKFYGNNPATQKVGSFDVSSGGEYYIGMKFHASNGAADNARAYLGEEAFNDTTASTGFATNGSYMSELKSIKLTVAGLTDADREIIDARTVDPGNATVYSPVSTAAEVKILTHDITSNEGSVYGEPLLLKAGSTETITAPDIEGKTFLYWAKGLGVNKHAVADTKEYTLTAQKGLTYLTAIYRDSASENITVEFYNANRALVSRSDAAYTEGDEITLPSLPYMTGLGQSSGWILSGTEDVYTNDQKPKATEKTMIFVAKYPDDPAKDISITVDGGTGSGSYAYGDAVTATATLRENGGSGYNLFNYWEKDGEIVSFDKEYTFRAVKNCTVKAVYKEYQPISSGVRKILLNTVTTGNENAVVAEFIGCESAIEKGFVFKSEATPAIETADYKVSMQTDGDYFSIIDDSGKNMLAYAIFDDCVIYSE